MSPVSPVFYDVANVSIGLKTSNSKQYAVYGTCLVSSKFWKFWKNPKLSFGDFEKIPNYLLKFQIRKYTIIKTGPIILNFRHLENSIIQQAIKSGESFYRNVSLVKQSLRIITDKNSSEFKHSQFQQQSPGIGHSEKLAMIGMDAAKNLLLGMGVGNIILNFYRSKIVLLTQSKSNQIVWNLDNLNDSVFW